MFGKYAVIMRVLETLMHFKMKDTFPFNSINNSTDSNTISLQCKLALFLILSHCDKHAWPQDNKTETCKQQMLHNHSRAENE